VDYLGFLHLRFAGAWTAVEAGDARLFAHLLKAHGYFTGPEDDGHGGGYGPTMAALFAEFSHLQTADSPDLETTEGVQRALALLGYAPGAPDGKEGPRTHLAIVAFQAARGLVQDGLVGPATRREMALALAALS
jgi:hypothetical protein